MSNKDKKEYKALDIKYQYDNYTGTEKWIIISDLSDEELLSKYPDTEQYIPFIRLAPEQGEVLLEANRNMDKFRKRAKKNNDSYAYEDGVTEIYHHELARLQSINTEMSLRMQAAIEKLPEKQKIRLIKYYYNAMNVSQIAREEGVSSQAVDKSIASAIEKLKKFLR